MSYATPQDMIDRYDVRRLGDLVRDDGTRATPLQLLTDTVLQGRLDDAQAYIDASCLRGARYSTTDLTEISLGTFPDMAPSAQNLLLSINCDLAFGLLNKRRAYNAADFDAICPSFKQAEEYVEALGRGERIFGLPAVEQAGLPSMELRRRVCLIHQAAHRYFGVSSEWACCGGLGGPPFNG